MWAVSLPEQLSASEPMGVGGCWVLATPCTPRPTSPVGSGVLAVRLWVGEGAEKMPQISNQTPEGGLGEAVLCVPL